MWTGGCSEHLLWEHSAQQEAAVRGKCRPATSRHDCQYAWCSQCSLCSSWIADLIDILCQMYSQHRKGLFLKIHIKPVQGSYKLLYWTFLSPLIYYKYGGSWRPSQSTLNRSCPLTYWTKQKSFGWNGWWTWLVTWGSEVRSLADFSVPSHTTILICHLLVQTGASSWLCCKTWNSGLTVLLHSGWDIMSEWTRLIAAPSL